MPNRHVTSSQAFRHHPVMELKVLPGPRVLTTLVLQLPLLPESSVGSAQRIWPSSGTISQDNSARLMIHIPRAIQLVAEVAVLRAAITYQLMRKARRRVQRINLIRRKRKRRRVRSRILIHQMIAQITRPHLPIVIAVKMKRPRKSIANQRLKVARDWWMLPKLPELLMEHNHNNSKSHNSRKTSLT